MNPLVGLAMIAALLLLGACYYGYRHWFAGVSADGASVESEIVDRFDSLVPGQFVSLTAHCPKTVRLHKGKIVDCSLTRMDTNQTTAVFVTGIDNSGHFSMQVEDPMILVKLP